MPKLKELQYLSDARGEPIGVVVPIDLWREIESEKETAYLLKSKAMKKRLQLALKRDKGIRFEEVRARLGV